MRDNSLNETDFAEDHLPADQPLIRTSSVHRLWAYMNFMTDPGRRYSMIGVVTGPAGIGKTIAAQAYLDELQPLAHTGLRPYIKLKLQSGITRRALVDLMMTPLGERPLRRRNRWELADGAAEAILRNDVRLVMIDEADKLTDETFELVRYIFDQTGRPIVLVGLPNIMHVITRYEKFASRAGGPLRFAPLPEAEVLDEVLPQLVFPGWEYDRRSAADRALGHHIWGLVDPSLRKLRNLLEVASRMTLTEGRSRITPETLAEAQQVALDPAGRRARAAEPPTGGEAERRSEARYDRKQMKRRSKHDQ